jgi:UrcA family protein
VKSREPRRSAAARDRDHNARRRRIYIQKAGGQVPPGKDSQMEFDMMTKTFVAAVALASIVASVPASAESFKFRYKPHELETAGGRESMMARLDRQADRYCGVDAPRGVFVWRAAKECRNDIVAEISAKIQNVEFAALVE